MANLAAARTTSALSLGQQNTRQTTSFGVPPAASFTTPTTLVTSSGDNQLMIAPSPSRAARRSMPSRRAATRIGGACSGRTPRRKPLTSNVSYCLATFSPLSASRRKRTTSRTFLYGSTNGTPFHRSTMTLLLEPMPMAKRPGAASARDATLWAKQAGERV